MRNSRGGQPCSSSLGFENKSAPYAPRKHAHTAPKTTYTHTPVRPFAHGEGGRERGRGGGKEGGLQEGVKGHDRACRTRSRVDQVISHPYKT